MLERASGQFTIEGNVEDIFGGISGAARIARISQTCLFTGALQGESVAEYTAVLPREGGGSFQGFQRISGALGEREGTFVICVTGDYGKGQPRGNWTIVPKSGSGDFVHIRGQGTFSQSAGKAGSYKLEFDLRKPRKARSEATAAERDELIPGIDIVAEDEPAPVIETVEIAPEPLPDRPKRRRATAEPVVVEPALVMVESKPKRARKAATTIASEPAPSPAIDEQPVARSSRKRPKPAPEPVAAAVEPVAPPPRKRAPRNPDPIAEPVPAETPATPQPKPSRRRKTAPIELVESVALAEPVALPVAPLKPARQRKAKAA